MKKFLTATLALALLAALLGGCMCQVADTTLNADGSGVAQAQFGFSEALVDAMGMRGEMAKQGFTYFTYGGRGYFGDQARERFSGPDEFNAVFADVAAEISDASGAASPGSIALSFASDGGLTLTLQCAQADRRGAIKRELAEQLPDCSDAQLDELMTGMVMTYRFVFPSSLLRCDAGAGIAVEDNVLTLDYLALEAGSYRFSTSPLDEPAQKALGSVTPESIPASGTAHMRRQTIEVDGQSVTFQTYALVGVNGETNYVRLRDIASVLSSTAARFDVAWDGSVVIVPLSTYTPNGTEMQVPFSGDRAYRSASAQTTIYGRSIPFTAITLTDDQGGGYTYYKLRDLGQVLGFNVGWSLSRGIYIESGKPYVG